MITLCVITNRRVLTYSLSAGLACRWDKITVLRGLTSIIALRRGDLGAVKTRRAEEVGLSDASWWWVLAMSPVVEKMHDGNVIWIGNKNQIIKIKGH